jgi:beta-ureidopropionase / N-carbamoyl-L-amino-acid hydrolase
LQADEKECSRKLVRIFADICVTSVLTFDACPCFSVRKNWVGQSMSNLPNIAVDSDRLWTTLMDTAAIGALPGGGIKRLALSDEDRRVRDWFRAACEAAGCTVVIDDVGNMFARRPGKRNDLPPIAMGSHLDTQPTGGKFDGILGVLAALEAIRTLNDAGYETNAPLEVINWTNEEGARFAPAMLASGAFAGVFTRDYAAGRTDPNGVTFGEALKAIGYHGPEPTGQRKLGAYFELHIEQGPILEAEQKTIGVVTGVQGIRWYEVRVTGTSAHTGATPMHMRKNALLGAARVVEAVHRIGLKAGPDAVATIGFMEVQPNSRNVVAGEVLFCADIRHKDESKIDGMERSFRRALKRILPPLGLSYDETCIWDSPAVHFDEQIVAAVRAGAVRAGHATRDIVSGAGHDAAYVARVAPSGMIFVPCAGGISHNEAESVTKADCGAGAEVLLEAVLTYDKRFG